MGVPLRSQHRGVKECVLELVIEMRPCLAVALDAITLTPPPASPAAPIYMMRPQLLEGLKCGSK